MLDSTVTLNSVLNGPLAPSGRGLGCGARTGSGPYTPLTLPANRELYTLTYALTSAQDLGSTTHYKL